MPAKILIVRFSSIGDIVLTTPVIRCVKEQTGAEIHFLTKSAFRGILEHNPHLTKVWSIKKDLKEVANDLQKEGFSAVIDLHNNLRCRMLGLKLWGVKFYRFNKLNREKWLLTKWGINRMPEVHIVQRYLAAAAPLGVVDDGKGLEYYPGEATVNYDFMSPRLQSSRATEGSHGSVSQSQETNPFTGPPHFLAFVIGAAHATKRLTEAKMIEFCQAYPGTTLLLGGPAEQAQGERIAAAAGSHVINTCGQFSLHQSAILVRDAAAVLTHDTGMMHIAAAYRKPIVSIWGNTVPAFGMYPYLPGLEAVEPTRRLEVEGLSCRPCSKIGYQECPKGHFNCINHLQIPTMVEKVKAAISTLCLVLCILFSGSLTAQDAEFAPPVRGPLLVTGTFGELRSDHFHAGLDLRGTPGTPVYAVADGYVSRLRISAGGYGQGIYIDHPKEGVRTVYGHLNSLRNDLIDTVRARQYSNEQFALDLRFDSLAFPVKRGDQIGTIGNRGYSFGPHLHFEVRDLKTDAALNPLNFGINVPDTRRPQLRNIKVYELDESLHAIREQFIKLEEQRDGIYVLPGQLVEVYSPRIGLGIKAYDQQNALPNYNGIFEAALYRDSTLVHAFRYDNIPFEATRYLNAHTDYEDWKRDQSWYHRMFRLPGDELGFYEVLQPKITASAKSTDGVMTLSPNQAQAVQLVVKDWAGNSSILTFSVIYRPVKTVPMGTPYQYLLPYDEPSIIAINDLYLEVPKGALYQDTRLRYQRANDGSSDVYSAVHHLHDELTPIHTPLRLKITPDRKYADALRSKLVVARCPAKRGARPVSYGAALKEDGGPAFVEIMEFGDYCILADTVPPTITPKEIAGPLSSRRRISFSIEDDFATAGDARGLRYRATLNGAWLLMEYDLKNDLLFHDFATPLPAGKYVLELRVMDDRGNEAVYLKEE